jgi:predicted MFS family arabinose efflux permease
MTWYCVAEVRLESGTKDQVGRLRWLLITSICYFFPFALFVAELTVLALDKLSWTPQSIGLLEPALNGLISAATGPREQGVVQGGNGALRSLTTIVGTLLAGEMYLRFGGETPYWLGAAVLLLGIGAMLLAAQHSERNRPLAETEID